MKVLVTGAAGQVGCRLVRQMLERNHEVRGTILPEDPCRERLAGVDLELVEGDLTDKAFVQSVVEGVEGVIHTANFVGPQFDNNLQINRLVARICGERADALDRPRGDLQTMMESAWLCAEGKDDYTWEGTG